MSVPTSTEPVLRVVSGTATDEELAALTAVLLSRLAGTLPAPVPLRSVDRWSRAERLRALWSPTSWRRAA
ncbi:acyl-CoA carboxylase subunit epsilon [Streptomyces shaanxiensis]